MLTKDKEKPIMPRKSRMQIAARLGSFQIMNATPIIAHVCERKE